VRLSHAALVSDAIGPAHAPVVASTVTNHRRLSLIVPEGADSVQNWNANPLAVSCLLAHSKGTVFGECVKFGLRHALILLPLLVIGCGAKKPPLPPTIVREVQVVEVKVPVPVERQPPAALLADIKPPLPVFVAPSDPKASSALTPDGELLLLALIESLLAQIDAWKVWATSK
jgi:hypothetical protein